MQFERLVFCGHESGDGSSPSTRLFHSCKRLLTSASISAAAVTAISIQCLLLIDAAVWSRFVPIAHAATNKPCSLPCVPHFCWCLSFDAVTYDAVESLNDQPAFCETAVSFFGGTDFPKRQCLFLSPANEASPHAAAYPLSCGLGMLRPLHRAPPPIFYFARLPRIRTVLDNLVRLGVEEMRVAKLKKKNRPARSDCNCVEAVEVFPALDGDSDHDDGKQRERGNREKCPNVGE